jgi:para-aminobenzoate synthetase
MRTLLIDNYDSFTYNLFQLLAEVNGAEPIVIRNDEVGWEELSRLEFDNVVLSPGPGRPENERDFGVCAEAIRHCEAPLLGVCLGHQGLGWVNGGQVVRAPEPLHGRIRTVEHADTPLFAGIPRRFQAVRYHSLCLGRPLPRDLQAIAHADDGVAMAVAHRSRPQWGVQFHPESVAGEHGQRLLANFRDLTRAAGAGQRSNSGARPPSNTSLAPAATKSPAAFAPRLELVTRRLDVLHDPERAFLELFAGSLDAFWLDSSRSGEGARFSYLGDAGGPLGATVSYDIDAREVTVERGEESEVLAESIFTYLERERERLRPLTAGLPFDFDCGFAGYLGYELKADCGGARAHSSSLPDAAFVFADRLIAFDHELGHTHLVSLVGPGGRAGAEAWIEATTTRLAAPTPTNRVPEPAATGPVDFRLARSRRRYLEDIAASGERLREGESYEVCLTNAIEAEVEADPLELYLRLRRVNPAPFSAYLRFGDLAILSSSPERFLSVDRGGGVEAKPIKGTSRRGEGPREDARLAERLRDDEKNRAENLMIVDLLRNDLGGVCAVGSVEVPTLMEVETYETVHQLVSTVRGRLRPEASALDCVRACFPPGSMTGAPKLRTMEILDELEGAPRGIYSGAIGYFGLSGGCDLAVTIRTVVLDAGSASIGAGGAIVLQSDPEGECEEMLLKAAAPMRAIDPGVDLAAISLTDPRPVAVGAPPGASAHDLTS